MSLKPSLPSQVIFTALLVLHRLAFHKDLRKGVIDYLYETVTEINELGHTTKYEVINGIKNGKKRRWYKSGQLWYEAEYKDGKLNGKTRGWYPSGKLSCEKEYKDGKKNGKSREWYESGKLKCETEYKDGKRNGKAREWYKSGKLKYEAEHKDGTLRLE